MKRLFFLPMFALLASMLIACEKENPAPVKDEAAVAAVGSDLTRSGYCPTYSYRDKTYNLINFGNHRTDIMLVGFGKGVTFAQRRQILRQYPAFRSATEQFLRVSGPITIVNLKPGTTCEAVTRMLAGLKSHRHVRFTAPVFDPYDPTIFEWQGFTNDVLVAINSANPLADMRQLCRQTNTRIVDELGPGSYVVHVDKNAIGNLLQICTIFNRSRKVAYAEPDLLLQYLPMMRKDNTVAGQYVSKHQQLNQL